MSINFNSNEIKAIKEMLDHCGSWSEENLGVPIEDIKSAYEKLYPDHKVVIKDKKLWGS